MSGIITDNIGRASGLIKAVTVSTDVVKLASADATTGTVQNYANIFDDSVYRAYDIFANWDVDEAEQVKARFLNDTTAYSGAGDYRGSGMATYIKSDGASSAISADNDGTGKTYIKIAGWDFTDTAGGRWSTHCRIMTDMETTSFHKLIMTETGGIDNTASNFIFSVRQMSYFLNTAEVNGIQFYTTANVSNFAISIYGYKK